MEELFGRLLTAAELTEIPSEALRLPSMTELSASKIRCERCGSCHLKNDVRLPIGAYYCPTCLNMKRVRSDEALYHLPQAPFPAQSFLHWTGQLTPYQQEISERLVSAVRQHEKLLVHAVTGAGKTEMIYAAVDEVLKNGGAVGLASPRIDVVIELHKRLSRDFACPIPVLYGGAEAYFRASLVIATTHQLLRFQAAFDLLIIDEVDAFPFVDNEMLYFAARKAQKAQSSLIYLTATSTAALDQQVRQRQLEKVHLARRFHGYPLVLPRHIWHKQFTQYFKKQRQSGFPLLIFAPEIELGRQFARQLQNQFPDEKIAFVASTSQNRLDIVEQFRQHDLSILVSTTILERGVTFAGIDVFVWHSEHRNFTRSALIQIAGRAGRSPERPTGLVYFFHAGKTRASAAAITEIKKMNRLGDFS